MWIIETTERFDSGFCSLNDIDRASVLSVLIVLRERGPMYADTVKGGRYSNIKELRIQSRGDPIGAFFAFDPQRVGILLCAASKAGNEKRFYNEMIALAECEYFNYLKKYRK